MNLRRYIVLIDPVRAVNLKVCYVRCCRPYVETVFISLIMLADTGKYRVVQKSGHPIYFCYNFSSGSPSTKPSET